MHHGVVPQIISPLASERCVPRTEICPAMKRACRYKTDGHALRSSMFWVLHPYESKNPTMLAHLLRRASAGRMVYVEDNSFPSGGIAGGIEAHVRKALRTPPMPIDIVSLYQTTSKVAKTRFVFLVRNFTRTVFSHPNWDGGVEGHAINMANYTRYFASAIKQLPREAWSTLPVDCLAYSAQARNVVTRNVRDFLGWQPPWPRHTAVPATGLDNRTCCTCFAKWRESRQSGKFEYNHTELAIVRRVEMEMLGGNGDPRWGPLQPQEPSAEVCLGVDVA